MRSNSEQYHGNLSGEATLARWTRKRVKGHNTMLDGDDDDDDDDDERGR